ncbi:hypothetical protein T492DRAFT_3106 [Pavlovales sp. CCMP2436]|nr:hypothetical protein T492DRAFT_3106 [Pavlovales sp. CCMP2436]
MARQVVARGPPAVEPPVRLVTVCAAVCRDQFAAVEATEALVAVERGERRDLHREHARAVGQRGRAEAVGRDGQEVVVPDRVERVGAQRVRGPVPVLAGEAIVLRGEHVLAQVDHWHQVSSRRVAQLVKHSVVFVVVVVVGQRRGDFRRSVKW